MRDKERIELAQDLYDIDRLRLLETLVGDLLNAVDSRPNKQECTAIMNAIEPIRAVYEKKHPGENGRGALRL